MYFNILKLITNNYQFNEILLNLNIQFSELRILFNFFFTI